LGTLNHFAKDLEIPLDLDRAVGVIAAAHGVNVDVGEVNGIVFINNSSIGVYPYMVLDRERLRGTGLRKWAAMALAGLHMLRVFPVPRLRVRAEGWVEPCRTPCLFVGNNKYTFNLRRWETRKIEWGELWFYIVKHQTRLRGFIWRSSAPNPNMICACWARVRRTSLAHEKTRRRRADGEVVFLRLRSTPNQRGNCGIRAIPQLPQPGLTRRMPISPTPFRPPRSGRVWTRCSKPGRIPS
jgi:hypothetical protein